MQSEPLKIKDFSDKSESLQGRVLQKLESDYFIGQV
jgi:hypothetical protein